MLGSANYAIDSFKFIDYLNFAKSGPQLSICLSLNNITAL